MAPYPALRRKLLGYATLGLILIAGAVVVASAFEQIPIEGTPLALDWRSLWQGLKGGRITYVGGSVMIAPWALPAVWPLGFFSVQASWGLLTLCTAGVLIASVPRRVSKPTWWLSIFLLVFSWPALRHAADGNLEGVVIAGVLLVVYGYRKQNQLVLAAGLLLVTAKPQESWLLVCGVGLYVLAAWPLRKCLNAGFIVAAVAVPALLLFGPAWFAAMTGIVPPPRTVIDISLGAALARLGFAEWVYWAVGLLILVVSAFVILKSQRTLSREKAAFLICASMLLAPYAAGNSFLTVLAIGIIPLFQSRRWLGGLLIILSDAQLVLPRDFLYWNGAYYWTAMLLTVWAICAYLIYRGERTAAETGQTVVGTA